MGAGFSSALEEGPKSLSQVAVQWPGVAGHGPDPVHSKVLSHMDAILNQIKDRHEAFWSIRSLWPLSFV
jgi:hypothetical protein